MVTAQFLILPTHVCFKWTVSDKTKRVSLHDKIKQAVDILIAKLR